MINSDEIRWEPLGLFNGVYFTREMIDFFDVVICLAVLYCLHKMAGLSLVRVDGIKMMKAEQVRCCIGCKVYSQRGIFSDRGYIRCKGLS